ncbi:phosphoglycerate mutase, 2,3-bisphosphoglycerate-independent [Thermosinus carboxydivorans Nor1]|uniref:2,3-bisphosphoglycerate-independent phosphoglycerate mutase n=1 Tax=Thermosinus carboxydivorans Nor1 TaxID=401526 RepID=A1HSR0_9FIRM|nr:2,3-bisphosphoglycerate-independent phosphoglycerate mutase [Thermosinus carboxydivorans]EAX46941.1 phosphoglycerate mutase, 2,3-bisphosphoglycerate-independent [Thermosinus carboxydivorans Nor1]
MTKLQQPIALIILDGWGIGRAEDPFNAIAQAGTRHIALLAELYPSTTLISSGEAVGLPAGQMGNSEVGHLNIGAGRIVYQELTRISKDIREGGFFVNPVLVDVATRTKAGGGALHLMGLLSDGGVHSHIDHLYALLELAKRQGLERVYVHAFLDGRDVPPANALEYVDALETKMADLGIGRIATIAGRYWAMDRDKRWERTEKAYAALVYRDGLHAPSARAAVEAAYARGETDEFVMPTVVDGCGDCAVKAGDGVIFFNFRPDRARQLTRAFVDSQFSGFDRRYGYFPLHFATMTQYDETLAVPVAYAPQFLTNTLGEVISKAGLTQLRIAETEKYAHVTYFFNGGEERPFANEDRVLIPSPKVATYDLQPEMSAPAVTDRAVAEIRSGKYDFIVINYANGDMVGHSGKFEAAVQAVATVDECVGRVVATMRERGGIVCITADHGNAECMRDETGEPFTAHTTNEVPFILVADAYRGRRLRRGILADIAPTILELAGLAIPPEMTGRSLLEK